ARQGTHAPTKKRIRDLDTLSSRLQELLQKKKQVRLCSKFLPGYQNRVLLGRGKSEIRVTQVEPRRIGTASIDTTCTLCDVEKGGVETRLIAHDKEVNYIV
ncbi:hypothetical protein Tco_1096488, partial [Tanacetum coccineum]